MYPPATLVNVLLTGVVVEHGLVPPPIHKGKKARLSTPQTYPELTPTDKKVGSEGYPNKDVYLEEGNKPIEATPTIYVINLIFSYVTCLCGCWLLSIPAIYYAKKAVKGYGRDRKRARRHCCTGAMLWVLAAVMSFTAAAIGLSIYAKKNNLLKRVPGSKLLGGWDSGALRY